MPVQLSDIACNIELGHDGLWAARTGSYVSYPESGNQNCFAIEESSFWFQHRNNCILEAARLFPPPGTFFDVGGGNGYVAWALQRAGADVVLVEPGPAGTRNALQRGIRQVVRSTLHDAGFLPETLPAVGLFDVLEHVQHDRAFLAEINRLSVPGARLYITVPAFRFLWSHEDREAGHWRRYTVPALCRTAAAAGFEVEFATYFFGFLPLPILLLRALPFRLGFARKTLDAERMRAEHVPPGPLVRRALDFFTRRERARIAARRPLRFGASCLLVARKVAHPQAG